MKTCNVCKEAKPRTEFHNREARCKACRRVRVNASYRIRYRTDSEFREKELYRARVKRFGGDPPPKRLTSKQRGHKACSGPCGRTLALYMFHVRREGWFEGRCYDCRREYRSERMKRLYAEDAEFREKEKARSRARYQSSARYRAMKKAADKRNRLRHKPGWIAAA